MCICKDIHTYVKNKGVIQSLSLYNQLCHSVVFIYSEEIVHVKPYLCLKGVYI